MRFSWDDAGLFLNVIVAVLSTCAAAIGTWQFRNIRRPDDIADSVRRSGNAPGEWPVVPGIPSITEALQRDDTPLPFETGQLEKYYGQILSQSHISFWFSLVFASLGFVVILTSAFFYRSESVGATVTQFLGGVVMDSVAALFFIQSKNAQTAMSEFFEKLRRDRQHLESRRLCESLENSLAKDALRIQLAVHYAEISQAGEIAQVIINAGKNPQRPPNATRAPRGANESSPGGDPRATNGKQRSAGKSTDEETQTSP